MNVITTFYTDSMIELRWDATFKQPQWRRVGTPADEWFDNTIVFSKPPTTLIREGGDVFTTANDWYYFSDTGTRNTLYDATNYGGCYRMTLSNESENINAYHITMAYGNTTSYVSYNVDIMQP